MERRILLRSPRSSLVLLAKAALIPLAVLALAGLAARARGFDPAWLFRDPVTAGGLPTYAGLISGLGNVLWVTTAGICLFAYWLARSTGEVLDGARYLLAAGLLTAVLGLDDLYQLHERIAPRVLGIPEQVVLGSYGAALAGISARFHRLLLREADVLLAVAMATLGGSLVVDLLAPNRGWYYLAEDGLKFVGIFFWATFHVRRAHRLVQPALVRSG